MCALPSPLLLSLNPCHFPGTYSSELGHLDTALETSQKRWAPILPSELSLCPVFPFRACAVPHAPLWAILTVSQPHGPRSPLAPLAPPWCPLHHINLCVDAPHSPTLLTTIPHTSHSSAVPNTSHFSCRLRGVMQVGASQARIGGRAYPGWVQSRGAGPAWAAQAQCVPASGLAAPPLCPLAIQLRVQGLGVRVQGHLSLTHPICC